MEKYSHRVWMALMAIALCASPVIAQANDDAKHINGQRDLTVEVSKPHKSPATATHHRAKATQINVSIMPIGPSSLVIGTPLRFKMTATKNGFGHLYVVNASGRTQLWFENIRLHAGRPIVFPRKGLIVRAAPPAGDETVIFVASRERVNGFGGRRTAMTPLDLQYTADALKDEIDKKFSTLPRHLWAFSSIQIRVHE